jgi:hypothetical protein
MDSGDPIASKTWLGSYFCDVHADPFDSATTPFNASMTASESRPGMLTFRT